MLAILEDTVNHTKSPNPLGSYLNAVHRGNEALTLHKKFFESKAHLDRIETASAIMEAFFGQLPDYVTPRGLGSRKPFESIKFANVGHILRRKSQTEKQSRLYGPLNAMGKVKIKIQNGHMLVSIY